MIPPLPFTQKLHTAATTSPTISHMNAMSAQRAATTS